MKFNYIVKKDDQNKSIKDILKNKLFVSNILINKLKMTNSILVNDEIKFVSYRVKSNDKIIIDFDNMNNVIYTDKSNIYYKKYKYLDRYKRLKYNLDIIYEDEYLLIVNKTYNMPIHPSCSNYETTLSNAVATYLESQSIYSIHIVTRLDKDTSGICIFAKNEYIQELFIRKNKSIDLKKEYIAIVNGILEKDHNIIEKNIARKTNSIILREINDNGDYAKTEYFVKYRNYEKNYTILEIILHTGRTHQIRVHMSSLGHVLLGDTLYAKEYNTESIDRLISRQALHAYKIEFNHPVTNKFISLTANIPEDMQELLIN